MSTVEKNGKHNEDTQMWIGICRTQHDSLQEKEQQKKRKTKEKEQNKRNNKKATLQIKKFFLWKSLKFHSLRFAVQYLTSHTHY